MMSDARRDEELLLFAMSHTVYAEIKKSSRSWPTEDLGFAMLLAKKIDKINMFYIKKEEYYIIGFELSY
ncbi:hypothetical protein PVK06_048787 [Gossypium arboreum]|uniref:Uncharacterized protein n=1 Tax=Gossypium arboreum TaxID=29729 RepID=A0ABR0MGX1_GOSAR|nr:hypothetical protein PVK06_048787 [Gossypium arboreum]